MRTNSAMKLRWSATFLSAVLAVACAPKGPTASGTGAGVATTSTLAGGATTVGIDATTLDTSGGVDSTTASEGTAVGTAITFHLQDAPPEGVTSVVVMVASVEAHVVPTDDDASPDSTTSVDSTTGADSTSATESTTSERGSSSTAGADATTQPDSTTSAPLIPAAVDTTTQEDALLEPAGAWVSLPVNKAVDLVAHQGEGAAALLGELSLPAGKVTQLRLVLDVSVPTNNVMTYGGGVTCSLNTDRVEKKGIKINKVFKAFESKSGTKGDVFLDFDLEESLKEDKQGDCWKLAPVLKLHKVKVDGREQAL